MALNRFFTAFNPSNTVAEGIMGENFWMDGRDWPAVALEEQETSNALVPGGKMRTGSIELTVRQTIVTQSGLAEGITIETRSFGDFEAKQRLRVNSRRYAGDDTVTFICGPVAVRPPAA